MLMVHIWKLLEIPALHIMACFQGEFIALGVLDVCFVNKGEKRLPGWVVLFESAHIQGEFCIQWEFCIEGEHCIKGGV